MLIVAALLATVPSGPDLLCPPGRSSANCKWIHFDGKPVPSSPDYVITGGPYGVNGVIESFIVKHPPTACHLKFSIGLRGSAPGQTFYIVTAGFDNHPKEKTKVTAVWEKSGALPSGKWTRLEYDLSLPATTNLLHVVIHNPNKETITMSAPSLVAGGPAMPDSVAIAAAEQETAQVEKERAHPTASPFQKAADDIAAEQGPVVAHVLIRAPLCTKKTGETGLVTFPVPALADGQVPLAFRIECKAPGKLLGYSWQRRKDKRNMVCNVTVQTGTRGAWVQYDALVLLGGPKPRDTAPARGDWTSSTACVQSSAAEIKAISDKLAGPGESREAYARKVYEFVRDDNGKGAPFKTLDALAALQCGGSCTNKANLVAALLRARGIPARTVAHMPTWCKTPLYEHWLAEYWQPGQGWVAIDSALGRWAPDRRTRIVLAVANPTDENLAFNPQHEKFVMPGAPYLSVAELSPTLFPADLTDDDAINSADQIACLPVGRSEEARLFGAAAKSFSRWSKTARDNGRYDRILSAAKGGKADVLMAAIRG